MTRDQLITLARDQQWSIEQYQRRVERLTDVGSAALSDGGIADKYQQERDEARQENQRYRQFFGRWRSALVEYRDMVRAWNDDQRRTVSVSDSHRDFLPSTLEIVERGADKALEQLEWFNGALNMPDDELESIMAETLKTLQEASLLRLIMNTRAAARDLATRPEMLAYDVYTQWEHTGTINQGTVIKLCATWKDAPEPVVLVKALESVRDYNNRPDGQLQQTYCDLHPDMPRRTLTRHLRMVENLKRLSAQAPAGAW